MSGTGTAKGSSSWTTSFKREAAGPNTNLSFVLQVYWETRTRLVPLVSALSSEHAFLLILVACPRLVSVLRLRGGAQDSNTGLDNVKLTSPRVA